MVIYLADEAAGDPRLYFTLLYMIGDTDLAHRQTVEVAIREATTSADDGE